MAHRASETTGFDIGQPRRDRNRGAAVDSRAAAGDAGSRRRWRAPGGATEAELLRIKAVLILKRNATRDYLDFVALSERMGPDRVKEALASA